MLSFAIVVGRRCFAQNLVGYCYMKGLGTGRNQKSAMRWLRAAALQDQVEAILNLALVYDKSDGVGKNDRKAFSYYLKAAQLDHLHAQTNLGLKYLRAAV